MEVEQPNARAVPVELLVDEPATVDAARDPARPGRIDPERARAGSPHVDVAGERGRLGEPLAPARPGEVTAVRYRARSVLRTLVDGDDPASRRVATSRAPPHEVASRANTASASSPNSHFLDFCPNVQE